MSAVDPRHRLILECAAKLFRHYGPGKTTVADIAREAQVGVGTVYLVFPSKEKIVEALSSGAHHDVIQAMRKIAAERAREDLAQRLGGVLEARTAEFQRLAQDGHSVRLLVDTPAGETEMRADWVVGSDGARSTVRRLLGLDFEGHTWPDRFVATNIEYDFSAHGYADANMVCDPVNWAVIAKLGRDNLWRVTYGEDASLDEMEALWQAAKAAE